jgi:hypothetical protein
VPPDHSSSRARQARSARHTPNDASSAHLRSGHSRRLLDNLWWFRQCIRRACFMGGCILPTCGKGSLRHFEYPERRRLRLSSATVLCLVCSTRCCCPIGDSDDARRARFCSSCRMFPFEQAQLAPAMRRSSLGFYDKSRQRVSARPLGACLLARRRSLYSRSVFGAKPRAIGRLQRPRAGAPCLHRQPPHSAFRCSISPFVRVCPRGPDPSRAMGIPLVTQGSNGTDAWSATCAGESPRVARCLACSGSDILSPLSLRMAARALPTWLLECAELRAEGAKIGRDRRSPR